MDNKPPRIDAAEAAELIGKLGGTTKLGLALGVPVTTVDSWRKNGVPHWRASAVRALVQSVAA